MQVVWQVHMAWKLACLNLYLTSIQWYLYISEEMSGIRLRLDSKDKHVEKLG